MLIDVRQLSVVGNLLILAWVMLPTSQVKSQIEGRIADLPVNPYSSRPTEDWLVSGNQFKTGLFRGQNPNEIQLSNGLISRTFRLAPNAATVGFENLITDTNVVRGVKPEAQVTIDGKEYAVGGLVGQLNYAFLKPKWLDDMVSDSESLQLAGFKIETPSARFDWKPRRLEHVARGVGVPLWPPAAFQFCLDFKSPSLNGVTVSVHYKMFDNLPVLSKWITIKNDSSHSIQLERFTSEILAAVEHDSRVESRQGVALQSPEYLHVETDFAFGGMTSENANRHVVHWRTDPQYTSQVNYKRMTPCLLVVEPTYGPSQQVGPGQTFNSFRTFELFYDSTDRERKSLSLRRMYRLIAPWVLENPLMHHMQVANPDRVRQAIDQAAQVGFEMVILSFGSGFNMEDDSPEYRKQWKSIADYAKSKGVEIGAYSLLSSRSIGGGNDIVCPPGEKPAHGNCPALTSEWGQAYYKKLYQFYETTGFSLLEHDGPYPGDVDVTSRPPLQSGVNDSRWVQGEIANNFYRWCASQGVYINAPDYYYLNGTNKCGMGYREVNWSLPRAMQVLHTRQNIYDGTWYKTPSMGWMFVPLSQYHGGGAAATIEPLDQHRDHYRQMLESNLAFGVQACYRGPRLFDTDRTKNMVKSKVEWFKRYRQILESDLIHGRRADGRNLDWMLHVNPQLENKGMLVVFNPTEQEIERKLVVDVYYTGLTDEVVVREQDSHEIKLQANRDYEIVLNVKVPPGEMNWFLLR